MIKIEKEKTQGLLLLHEFLTKEESSLLHESEDKKLLNRPEEPLTFIRELGRGSTGVVYLVRSEGSKEVLALKKIPLGHLPKWRQRLKLKEVLMMKALNHPHIIRYSASYIENNELCLLMEFAPKGDLATLIKSQREKKCRLSESVVMDLFWQLALSVMHLHSHQIIHRDIKPLNILTTVDTTGRRILKLADLGDCRFLSGAELKLKGVIGTPLYMAPEIIQQENYDNRVDIWALGCVLYEMMELVPPFSGDSLGELFHNIQFRSPRLVSGLYSGFLTSLCMRLLSKNRVDRPLIDQVVEQLSSHFTLSNIQDTENLAKFKILKSKLKFETHSRFFKGRNARMSAVLSSSINELKSTILGKKQLPRKHNSIKRVLEFARKELALVEQEPKPHLAHLNSCEHFNTFQSAPSLCPHPTVEPLSLKLHLSPTSSQTINPSPPISECFSPISKWNNLNVHHIPQASDIPCPANLGSAPLTVEPGKLGKRRAKKYRLYIPDFSSKSPIQRVTIKDLD